ncbi:MAG: radical SAM protein [Enhydrobacter sp.]|nr:radical SAM protein [Enhydrobacter sp.]
MVGLVDRLSRYLDHAGGRVFAKSAKRSAQFAGDKIESIRSYADFCRTGTSPAYPLEIFLEISNICDLKCAMCVQFSALNAQRLSQIKRTARGFMDQGEISENIEEALRHAFLVHCFGYGEPTIHPTFRSFLDLISRYEVMIDFFTNGMHLDEEFCRFLVDRRVYQITVSFSGATKEVYESIYLGGNFERVLGGIKRVADLKKARGSRFPIIEVNSLGFHDHVAQFDGFVSLMADHGVDTVLLKPLRPEKTIPELYEHVSLMRPDKEGEIVARAIKIGRQRGVEVNASLYVRNAPATEEEYDRQVEALKASAIKMFGETGRRFGSNPVSRFAALAEELEPVRDPDVTRAAPRVLSLDSPPEVARALLKVQPLEGGGGAAGAFHCMEPFKTLYLTRNGAARPCCFSNPQSWHFGDAKQDDALSIWRGAGFEVTRTAIAQTSYPTRSCEVCTRRRSGPQGHFAKLLLGRYLGWHGDQFDKNLAKSIEAHVPGVMQILGRSPAAIMDARNIDIGESAPGMPEASWPFERSTTETEHFIATPNAYAHRDFLLVDRKPVSDRSSLSDSALGELQLLLEACGRRFAGNGSIVDLGLPSFALAGLVSGMAANPAIESIAASFRQSKHSIVERFDLCAHASDASDPQLFIKPHVGELSKLRWLASKPIELCLVNSDGNDRPFQSSFRQLLRHFIVGETIVVQTGFYRHESFYAKVLMAYLGGSFEWLGQVGLDAIFRFTRPVPNDLAELEPYPNLPADLCLRFHRQWKHPGLRPDVQMNLDLSYANLLAAAVGRDAAMSHLDTLLDRYRDDLVAKDAKGFDLAGRLADARERLSASTIASHPGWSL